MCYNSHMADFFVFLRNISIIIYVFLFFIGAVSGTTSFNELWEYMWRTPVWKQESIREARKRAGRSRTPYENLQIAAAHGLSFAGYFLYIAIGLIVITAVLKDEKK